MFNPYSRIQQIVLCGALIFPAFINAQSASHVLEKSVQYHDPNGEWKSLRAKFTFKETRSSGNDRVTVLELNNAANWHKLNRDDVEEYEINGREEVKVLKGDREAARGKLLRNYYVFLWGLPMKLLDQGTPVQSKTGREKVDGKDCITVNVNYEKEDYTFFFAKTDYRLVAYRFWKKDGSGQGEMILLEDEIQVGSMKIPQKRSWYELPENKYLGTDILTKVDEWNF